MTKRLHPLRLLLVLVLPCTVLAFSAVSEVETLKGSGRSLEDALARSAGCLSCHQGIEDIHNGRAHLACTDCHGGKNIHRPSDVEVGSERYQQLMKQAHVQPLFPEEWPSSANPERTYTLLNRESPEFVRFVNPSDLRVSDQSCGTSQCHARETLHVKKSMMTTGAMLWGAALYNNGSYPLKDSRFGESYSNDGVPQRILAVPPPTPEETALEGILPYLDPLPRWDVMQPSNILRTWERGGRTAAEVGLPDPDALPGRPPRNQTSARGFGTGLRTDPVYLGLQKTRLPDPMLSFLGTNDQPGDYRSSGCAACHMVYANDRDPYHSGPYAQYGNQGFSSSADPTLPKDEPGHPIRHSFTRAIPTSQCIVCHVHPGTLVLNTYLGYTWWDLETDGEVLYPKETRQLDPQQVHDIQQRNPQGSALKGLWGDREFLKNSSDLNDQLQHTQFADFHGHGWMYRAVFKQDRRGQLLDAAGEVIPEVTSEALGRAIEETTEDPASREGVPVHLKDIHLERGMHCVDCHFANDSHGNGNLYGESRNAVEITCEDCHGTVGERARPTDLAWTTKGPAGGQPLLDYQNTPFDTQRFFEQNGKLHQRSAVEPEVVWEVVQVADTLDPSHDRYNEKARLAKTVQKGGAWGDVPSDDEQLAHRNSEMTCYACHSSWVPSCFGCHLSTKANQKKPSLHNEGEDSRNWTSYNWQTLRDDSFMLGRDGTVTGRRIAPVRSACAVMVSSQNANGEWLYYQQQTISTEGYSGHAFSTHFPHTVRNTETRACVDCHLSEDGDNNAYMAMALTQGTNFYNFLGRYVFVGEGERGFEAVVVTEEEEPQAVIGSRLHELAYPENHAEFVSSGRQLEDAYSHRTTTVLDLQARGEYLYAAAGKDGLQLFDIATLPNKGFAQRLVKSPVSPLGQRLSVDTTYATAVASPATIGVDPTREHRPENEEAEYRDDRQPIHMLYAYLYVTDREEGLILISAATLLDGNPANNFFERAVTFNPDDRLAGANDIVIAGHYAYITADRGLLIVDIDVPTEPRIVAEIGAPHLEGARAVQVQFRYAFVLDRAGLSVIDITDPEQARPVSAQVEIADARNLYLVRTDAYVAAGAQGLAIVDIERPEAPALDRFYDAGGVINDATDVKVGMTNVSLFAYVADGSNGLRVIQLTSAVDTPGHYGFSPDPTPRLVATYQTRGPALALSEGIDRDRAVDESGNQLAVFGRRGARPLNAQEAARLFKRDNELYVVPGLYEIEDIRRFFGPPRPLP